MIYRDSRPEHGYGNLTPAQVDELEEVFYTGYCWVLAVTLHRLFGYPIEAHIDEYNIVEHAWVVLPDGRKLDIAGPANAIWGTVTHANMTEADFYAHSVNGSCHVPEDTPLQLTEDNFAHCTALVNEYLLPRYHFTTPIAA